MARSAKTGGSTGTEAERPGTLAAGVAAGLVGGVAMAAWMMASALVDGAEPLAPLRPLADTFSDTARERTAAALLLGLALHLAFSAVVGLVLTALVPPDFPVGAAGAVCTGMAFLVMALMVTTVLPRVNPSMRAWMPAFGGAWVIAHALYGLTVGIVAQAIRHRSRARVAELHARHA